MIGIYCIFVSDLSGSEIHRVSTGPTIGAALDTLRLRHRHGVAHHHPEHGKELFYALDQEPLKPIIKG